jgi:hypothetical protein
LGEELIDLETGLQAIRICLCREMESTEGGFNTEIGKGLDVGKFLPFTSMLTEIA